MENNILENELSNVKEKVVKNSDDIEELKKTHSILQKFEVKFDNINQNLGEMKSELHMHTRGNRSLEDRVLDTLVPALVNAILIGSGILMYMNFN